MKTLQELEALTDDELRVMLASAQGWLAVNDATVPDRVWPCKGTITGKDGWWMMFPPHGYIMSNRLPSTGLVACYPPDYPADLNAVHEAEKTLTDVQKIEYALHLEVGSISSDDGEIHYGNLFGTLHATARQRTIYLILTLQKP